jgi:deazaflavin-dependent oxidoreductase (nitroreductase family)
VDYLQLADRSWPILSRFAAAHTTVYRASNGRLGHHIPFLPPMLLLEHRGARTGKERTTPLVYAVDGDDLVVVASKGGYPSHPAWYHNLLANPDTVAQVGGERRRVRATVADPEQRARLWPLVLRTYPGFGDYQKRAEREIPLVVLRRR